MGISDMDKIKIVNRMDEDDFNFLMTKYTPRLGACVRNYHGPTHTGAIRQRHLEVGSKNNQQGDIIYVLEAYKSYRWTKASENGEGHRFVPRPYSAYYKAVILFRYYTINDRWKNNHARVKIVEGAYKDKKISIRY